MKPLFILVLGALISVPAFAQATEILPITDEIRWTLAAAQIKASLEDDKDAIKTQTLKNAIVLATLYRDKVDLTLAIPALRNTFEASSSSSHRRLALAAMQAIGTGRAMDYVERNSSPKQFDESRLLVASVLNDYYQAHIEASS